MWWHALYTMTQVTLHSRYAHHSRDCGIWKKKKKTGGKKKKNLN